MAEERQPRRAIRARRRAVVLSQYAAGDILVDVDTEYKGDLLGDAPAAEPWIPSFHHELLIRHPKLPQETMDGDGVRFLGSY